jgi:hypothetical protein
MRRSWFTHVFLLPTFFTGYDTLNHGVLDDVAALATDIVRLDLL